MSSSHEELKSRLMNHIEEWKNKSIDKYFFIKELMEIKYDIESNITRLEDKIALFNDNLSDNEAKFKERVLSEKEIIKIKEENARYNDDIKRFESILKELEMMKKTCEFYLSEKKIFDKYKCFRNIRALMNEKGVKLGQIENEAGVRIGYMSRLEKPDSESEPGVVFLVTAAKMLDVSIDELINNEPGELNDDEKYIKDFVTDLISDTKSHAISWGREDKEIREYFTNLRPMKVHPLMTVENFENGGCKTYAVSFVSKFYADAKVYLKKCYSADLPGTKNKVYMAICHTDKNEEQIPDKQFIELYILNNDRKASPVCNQLKTASSISSSLDDLYNQVVKDVANIHISRDTRGIIDGYKKHREN